jgi:toluene monooxygenase system ferredoxin subunit
VTSEISTLDRASASEAIAQAAFFSSLGEAGRRKVASVANLVEFPSGKDIYALGEKAEYCYVLVGGIVRFNLRLGDRTAAAGEIIRRGELFGWAALIKTAQRRIATASCVTPCALVTIEGDALLALMDQDHSLGYAIMTRVSQLITSTITALVTG